MADDFEVVGLREFQKEVLRWQTKAMPKEFATGMRKIGLTALTRFVDRTPVGNPDLWDSLERADGTRRPAPDGYAGGRARGNWQASINVALVGTVDGVDKSGAKTKTKGFAMIESLLDSQAIGSIIYLSNNLPYIIPLEEGHSSQAPAGSIIAITIAELRIMFNEF